jgi:hypothetical protein
MSPLKPPTLRACITFCGAFPCDACFRICKQKVEAMRWHTSWNERLRGFEARALIASTALRTDSVSHGKACTGSVAWDVDGFHASGAGGRITTTSGGTSECKQVPPYDVFHSTSRVPDAEPLCHRIKEDNFVVSQVCICKGSDTAKNACTCRARS